MAYTKTREKQTNAHVGSIIAYARTCTHALHIPSSTASQYNCVCCVILQHNNVHDVAVRIREVQQDEHQVVEEDGLTNAPEHRHHVYTHPQTKCGRAHEMTWSLYEYVLWLCFCALHVFLTICTFPSIF